MNSKLMRVIFLFGLMVLFVAQAACAQPQKICGAVVDARSGEPLAGVEIKIANSAFVATTDTDGNYCLDYAPGEFQVQFKAVGYFPQAIALKLAQKAHFPMEIQQLQPSPILLDMYGAPVVGAQISLMTAYQSPQATRESSDTEGRYAFDFAAGNIKVLFEKSGFRQDGFECNLQRRLFPQEDTFILCPDKFGIYFEGGYFAASPITHRKAAAEPYRGGLSIPRIKGHWEGDYFLTAPPRQMQSSNKAFVFYAFPEISARLGSGGDPFEPGLSFVLLRVAPDGKMAEFNAQGGRFEKVDFSHEMIVERVSSSQGGLVSQKLLVYKIEAHLSPGKYAFCQFKKPPLHRFYIPGEVAYSFEVIP